MADPIDFYFDFSSPYGYFGAEKIEDLAASFDRAVRWKPILLGAIFKETGSKPLMDYPLKNDYARHDLVRLARFMELPFTLPEPFPIATTAAARAFYVLHDKDETLAKDFALAVFRAYYIKGEYISKPEVVVSIAGDLGEDSGALFSTITNEPAKVRLREEIEAAIAAGVFGSPYFIIDGEAFWGADRFWMMKRWLKNPW